MITIFFRTIIIYILLLLVIKLTGKRQIGELDISELVTALILSELAVSPISDNNIPLIHAVIPIIILLSLEIILTYTITKCNAFKNIISSKPSYLISKGILNQKELEKMRMSLDEFIGELRLKDINDINNVNYAILESNGKMAVFPKSEQPDNGIAHPIVIDGTIIKNNLQFIGQTEAWVLKKAANHKCDLSKVFLFTVDDNGNENFIRKEN